MALGASCSNPFDLNSNDSFPLNIYYTENGTSYQVSNILCDWKCDRNSEVHRIECRWPEFL